MTEPAPTGLDQHIARFFELSKEAMAIADTSGHLKRVNHAFRELLGYREDELIERDYLELVHPDDLEEARAVLHSAVSGDEPVQYMVRVARADGNYLEMLWTVNGVPEGDVVLGTGIDISRLMASGEHEKAMLAADIRRRQALQVNDDLTQGLVVAKYALEENEIEQARDAVQQTLRSAQRIAQRLLEESDEFDAIQPGDLVRGKAASFEKE